MKNPIPRSIWTADSDELYIEIIDQRFLPHKKVVNSLKTLEDTYRAIKEMEVRGAPLIGITAAFGVYFALLECDSVDWEIDLYQKTKYLESSRPTAVNLSWAVNVQLSILKSVDHRDVALELLWENAIVMMEEDAEACRMIGEFGIEIIENISKNKNGDVVNILTHCNAGSLACIEWGTATSPIYQANLNGINVHVWVDETRPRNQGAQLTAWELQQAGVPHTIIVDNAGGQLMQNGMVDLVIVGSDRVTTNGDVANKIGTYLKALAAIDNNIPFYVALPTSTIDWNIEKGSDIEIETRSEDEVRKVQGLLDGKIVSVLICPENSKAHNLGFDITPAKLVTSLITEKGIFEASPKGLQNIKELN